MPPIVIPDAICNDLDRASGLEWLETNGTGSFAMGTVSGVHTRRYHGWLVAAPKPLLRRHMFLSKLEEVLHPNASAGSVFLGANQYPGVIHPKGFEHLMEFRLDPYPTWEFEALGVHLTRMLFFIPGEDTVVILYRANRDCTLRIQPLLAFRDYHSLTRKNLALNGHTVGDAPETNMTRIRLRPYPELPDLWLMHSGHSYTEDAAWYYNFEYREEQQRGLDFREDLFRPGHFELDVSEGKPGWVIATLHDVHYEQQRILEIEAELRYRRRSDQRRDPYIGHLEAAAETFIAKTTSGTPRIIAGFPWFAEWGRDTMIALPGLLIGRGQLEAARSLLLAYVARLNQGLIPNHLDESDGHPEYNTADATLWLFQTVNAYLQVVGDRPFLEEVWFPAAHQILEWHQLGTLHGIRVDERDGLLCAGHERSQLTWMDARVDGIPVTGRAGKPVEINALYYNALKLMGHWATILGLGADAQLYEARARRCRTSFETVFWNPNLGCLYDVVSELEPDARIRPNQLFALSLAYPLLSPEQRASTLKIVEQELLTPYGLRTLSPRDPGYRSHYTGDPRSRDSSYHQGTVWPWLLGAYVRAYLLVHGRGAKQLRHCRDLLAPLEQHLNEACLGTISEIFDADPPHNPRGAPAQAWSVAEILRILQVDLA